MKRKIVWLLLAVAVLALTACSAGGENQTTKLPPEPEDGVLIYAALNPVTNELQSSINRFNESHTDAQMEIRDYSDENGPERLLTELAAGRVPDIMELCRPEAAINDRYVPVSSASEEGGYWMPYRQLAQKGYLEDLWPYIDNDPDLGREALLETPLKAAEVNGSLYMLFHEVQVMTLMGPARIVGNQYSWTFDDRMEAFSAMPADATILRYNATKWDVFSKLLRFSLDQYIDWEHGKSTFDSGEFRNMLEFLNTFPAEFETSLSEKQVEDEIIWRILNGKQMLEGTVVDQMTHLTYRDALWGEPASFVGYPMTDGESGSLFVLQGPVVSMSSACQNKEAAWGYIRWLVCSRYHNVNAMDRARRSKHMGILINKNDYELGNQADLVRGQEKDLTKDPEAMAPWKPFYSSYGPDIFPMDNPSEEDIQRFDRLINNTAQIYWPNDALANIVWEACGPYFTGDKTLDDTVSLIQNRVQLYVNENR